MQLSTQLRPSCTHPILRSVEILQVIEPRARVSIYPFPIYPVYLSVYLSILAEWTVPLLVLLNRLCSCLSN